MQQQIVAFEKKKTIPSGVRRSFIGQENVLDLNFFLKIHPKFMVRKQNLSA